MFDAATAGCTGCRTGGPACWLSSRARPRRRRHRQQ